MNSLQFSRNSIRLLIVGLLVALFGVWRIVLFGNRGESVVGGALLALIVFGTAGCALLAGRLTDREGRYSWFAIAAACLAWGNGRLAQLSDDRNALIAFNACHIVFVALIVGVFLRRNALAGGRESWRKTALDLVPGGVVLLVLVWTFMVGPFVLSDGPSERVRITAILHATGAALLGMLVLGGHISRSEGIFGLYPRQLLNGLGFIAIGDALWLHRWLDHTNGVSAASDICYCAGFLLIAHSAIVTRTFGRVRISTPDRPSRLPGMRAQVPNLGVMILLLLAVAQLVTREVLPYGAIAAIAGSLIVVLFVAMRQTIVLRKEHMLHREIDELSEQIDGLISQVGRDPLTGLLNHRAVHERLEHELIHGRSFGHPVAVALIDVDNFKTINDTLGHQTGDRVLHAVASVLTAVCRGTDVAARYAGDEFMLILPGLNEAHVASVSDRIVSEVRRLAEDLALGRGVRVSLSVGVAVTHTCRRNVTQVIAIADAAMYDAKEAGKDQGVVVNADTLIAASNSGDRPHSLRIGGPLLGPGFEYEIRDRRGGDRTLERAS